MIPDAIRRRLDGAECAALTAFAEARGDHLDGSSVEERIAVLCVIRNRAVKRHQTITEVCLAPNQFSCWNAGDDANHRTLLAQAEALVNGEAVDPLLQETLWLAHGVIDGVILDRTRGATVYYAPDAMIPPRRIPAWDWSKLSHAADIGSQKFYREV